jgi:hypothetical protein
MAGSVTLTCDLHGPRGGLLAAAMTVPSARWLQVTDGGTCYLSCVNAGGGEATLDLYREHVAPIPITIGTPVTGAALSATNTCWLELDVAESDWLVYQANPASFDGDLNVGLYSRTNSGEVDGPQLPQVDGLSFSTADDSYGRIVVNDSSRYLVRVSDDGSFTAGSHFDLAVSNRTLVDLGAVDAGAPLQQDDIAIAAHQTQYFLARVDPGELGSVEIIATGDSPVVVQSRWLGDDETARDTAGDAETLVATDLAARYVAFSVTESADWSGTFDLEVIPQIP